MMVLLGDVGQVEARIGPFGDTRQDKSTVCTKCTIGSEIALSTLEVLLGGVDQEEDRFSLFRDIVNLDAG
jgi:hypothetical protein